MRRLVALLALSSLLLGLRRYEPPPPQEGVDVDAWVAERQAQAAADGVRPGDDERLVRRAEGKTPLAILYIHGFGASRAGGEAVVEPLGEALGANTLYMRLPGHGVEDPEYLHAADPEDYLAGVEEAFHMALQLGDKVVLVGSSTGGLLATWAASLHSPDLAALVLESPFYDFADPSSAILSLPGKRPALRLVVGKYRDTSWNTEDDPEGRPQPGYNEHWTTTQRGVTLIKLEKLRAFVDQDEVYAQVTAPTLLFAYYKDAEHQDTVASVAAMHEAYEQFGSDSAPNPNNRFVELTDSNHIMFSSYVRTDKDAIFAELSSFFTALGYPVAL
ncbi:MAG: alpha/beta fold hydrolase [Anaerolineae bacterium]|nr:alpha/beta fold hydrolase [Anaerolineae bacterium]